MPATPEPEVLEVVEPVVPPEPEPVAVLDPGPLIYWTVVKGENLWSIAAKEEVYNVPEKWPLIYKANQEEITDADLIYPGQILDIPRDLSQDEIDAAIGHARSRGAWTIGPVESADLEYLNN